MKEKSEKSKEIMVEEERELGVKPIVSLFTKFSLLTLVGVLAQVIMVLLEGVIIGRGLGERGLACIGLIFPLEYFMLALGGFFAIGISSLAAMKLGSGDKEGARRIYGQGLIFSSFTMIIIALGIYIFAPYIATLLGTPPELMDTIILFIRIFMFGYPFCIIGHIAVYMARVDEKPHIAAYALAGSAIAAILWLYSSIHILELGIIGSAGYYASSIGLWGVSILYFFFSKKTIFKVKKEDWKLDMKIIGAICKVGFPYLLIQSSSTVFSIVLNNFFRKYGSSTDIAAFAVINGYIIYILVMITQATIGGMQPIASYNIGAKLFHRVAKLIKVSVTANLIVIYAIAIIFFVFSKQICFLFLGDSSELLDISAKYAKIILIGSGLGLTANVMSGYFQAVEKVGLSTILGVCRYILFGIPLIYIMAKLLGNKGIWYGQPIADGAAFLLSILFCVVEVRKLKRNS
ncbi:MATE family efflux transporter [Lacrimispora sp.]|uniref:MATE family efflux transporter n=1 Tax=Lacrimispora sp. TaxID=2719234 RepID=UPI0039942475